MIGHGVAQLCVIMLDIVDRPEVMGLPAGEQEELVEKVEGGRGRLMDARDDYQLF